MIASLIIIMHFMGWLTPESAIACLYVTGILLIIAEIGVVSFGLLAINGMIALYAAFTLQTGAGPFIGLQIGWPFLFGIAFVELIIISSVIAIHLWLRNKKTSTGTEGMIGQKAVIIDWDGKKGHVRYEGEIWNATSNKEMELSPDEEVQVSHVNKLDLIITA